MVRALASHGNGPGSIPGPGIVQLWICVLLNEVTPRRSDGTLNRGLVCVTHQAWTIKIPTSLRKRICDCRLIQTAHTLRSAALRLQVGIGIHTSKRLRAIVNCKKKKKKEFASFASYLGYQHDPVTPLWPEANGGVERFMRVLKKIMQTAHLEGKNWKQELYRALLNYRATPHSTTGISPAEVLFGRKIRTRLPEPEVAVPELDAEIRHNDTERKRKIKDYADDKRHTKVSDLKVGDSVLVRQPRENKLTTPFNPEPLEITQKKGTMVTARNSRKSITRNSSFFKKVPFQDNVHETPEPELEIEELSNELNPDTPVLTEVAEVETPTSRTTPVAVRRSSRVCQAPARHKDYVRH